MAQEQVSSVLAQSDDIELEGAAAGVPAEGAAEQASAEEPAPLRLSAAQKRILGYISAQTTLAGGARCSKKALAKEANCSVQTVDRAIARLRKLGLVEVVECHDTTGAQLANVYRAVH